MHALIFIVGVVTGMVFGPVLILAVFYYIMADCELTEHELDRMRYEAYQKKP